MADIVHLYSQVVLTSLIATFIMGVIIIRIPPLFPVKGIFIEMELSKQKNIKKKRFNQQSGSRFKRALDAASLKSEELTVEAFF